MTAHRQQYASAIAHFAAQLPGCELNASDLPGLVTFLCAMRDYLLNPVRYNLIDRACVLAVADAVSGGIGKRTSRRAPLQLQPA
jgi:hypothetical protein